MPQGLLKPGEYAQVSMGLPAARRASAPARQRLMFRAEGLRGGDRWARTTAS